MINAYKNYWKGYLDFKGRTDLPGYWLAALAGFIVFILINILSQIISSSRGSSGSSSLLLVYSLISLLPSLAITVRRLRDGGKSWANLFWLFLPLAGPIVLIVKLCASSQALNAFSSGPASVSREAPLYRSYQPQGGSAASAGPAVSPAVSKSSYVPAPAKSGVKVPLSSLRPYRGSGVCDVCNRSLSGVNAYIVPNNVFYASPEYRKHYADLNAVFLSLSGHSAEQALRYMQLQDHSEGSAVCENCIHMFAELPTPAAPAAEEQEKAGESRKQEKDTFYVFAAKGAAFGNPGGDIAAIIREKAEKLRDGYEPAKNMELSVIYPEAWGGTIAVSSQNGIITSSVNFADHKQAIRNYLEKAGADSSLIEAGIAEAEKESLILSNPFSGVTVMGIPVAAEKPAEPADARTPINNFCMNCGAKLSENAAVCSQCGTAVPDSW